jgi:hypothetical protein
MLDHFLGVGKLEGIESGGGFTRLICKVNDEFEAVVIF